MKVALVTGAGVGLGSELARRLSRADWAVALHCHSSRDAAQRLADECIREGGRAEVFQGDLGREEQTRALASAISQHFGRLDLLINNAGVYHATPLETLSEAEWDAELGSTAKAAFFTTRACLPMLRAVRGRVVNIGDSAADRGGSRDLALAYHIGKSGVWMITRSMARSEAAHEVAVNMISPGWLPNSIDLPDASTLPSKRHTSFDDIWCAVEFLAERAPHQLTGSNLVLSGGWNI